MLTKLKPKSEFSRNVLTLMSGTTIAQGIPIAISPILTRIYTPEDFGVLALYIALFSLIGIIATARYEVAIVLPKHDKNAINVLFLSIFITVIMTVLSLLIILFFREEIVNLFNAPSLLLWLYFVPISVLFTGLYQTFNYWHSRNKQYGSIAKSRISQGMSTAIVHLSAGYGGYSSYGLVFGHILGQILATFVLLKKFVSEGSVNFRYISMNRILFNARKYKKFPLINSFHALMDIFQSSGVIFIISMIFSSTILGFYSMTMRIMGAPINLIGGAMAQVYYQKATSIVNERGDLFNLTRKMMINLTVISLPIMIVILLFGETIFKIVLGENWGIAGIYAQLLSPYFFFRFIISPISSLPNILDRQGTYFIFTLVGNSIMLSSIIIAGILFDSVEYALMAISILMSILFLIQLVWLLKISREAKC